MKLSLKNITLTSKVVSAEAHITDGYTKDMQPKTIWTFPVSVGRTGDFTLEQCEQALRTKAEELVMRIYEDIVCGVGAANAVAENSQSVEQRLEALEKAQEQRLTPEKLAGIYKIAKDAVADVISQPPISWSVKLEKRGNLFYLAGIPVV